MLVRCNKDLPGQLKLPVSVQFLDFEDAILHVWQFYVLSQCLHYMGSYTKIHVPSSIVGFEQIVALITILPYVKQNSFSKSLLI